MEKNEVDDSFFPSFSHLNTNDSFTLTRFSCFMTFYTNSLVHTQNFFSSYDSADVKKIPLILSTQKTALSIKFLIIFGKN